MFLQNYWYVAAWAHEIERRPLGRILLNQPVVFFRQENGAIAALEDRCPHRAYPLHRGQLIGDTLQCGYHGMTFDASGRCIRVPGQAHVPSGANLRVYPVFEQWGLVWIWLGQPSLADRSSIVDWHLLGDPGRDARGEHLHLACNYQLIVDNLLDLSHLTYVHPHTLGSAAKLDEVQISNEISADCVVNSRWLIDIAPPPTYARRGFKGNVDRWQITTFHPPAFLSLYAGAAASGSGAPEGNFSEAVGLHTFNAMTPETATTTHYFWALAQERGPLGENLADAIFTDIQKTVQEDIAVFEAQQQSLDLQPNAPMVAIKSDAAPLAARRIIERLLNEEHSHLR